MSHFAIFVIGDNVEQQLQPFHEFECTGTNDQYVQDQDKTEEKRSEYNEGTRSMVRLADGTLISAYDDACYRYPTEEESKKIGPVAGSGWSGPAGIQYTSKDWGDGKGYQTKVHQIPEGGQKADMPYSEVMTFRQYIEDYSEIKTVPHGQQPDINDAHKYGYATLTADGEIDKVIRRTNPNKKWDWWVVGGRWSGFLKLKDGTNGKLGRKGLMGSCASDGPGRADHAVKGAIDFDGMRQEAGDKAAERWDKAAAIHGGKTWDTWEHARDVLHKGNIDAAREHYQGQDVVKALRKVFSNPFHDIDQYLTPRDQFIQKERDKATVLYAVVKDGKWIAKGEMGWFGMSDDKVSQDEWNRMFNEMLDALPDDTPITVVDCHI